MRAGEWKIVGALALAPGKRLPLSEVLRAAAPQGNIGDVNGLQQAGRVTGHVGATTVNIMDAGRSSQVMVTLTPSGLREAMKPYPSVLRYLADGLRDWPDRRPPKARETMAATGARRTVLTELAAMGLICGVDPEAGRVDLTAFKQVPLEMRLALTRKGRTFVPSTQH